MPSRKIVNILLHVLCTALIVIVPLFVMPLKESEKPDFQNVPRIAFTLLQTAAFYFSGYVLYPVFIHKRRVAGYVITVLSLSILLALVPGVLEFLFSDMPSIVILASMAVKFLIGVFVMATGTAYRFIIDAIKQQNRQQEHMAMELSFLRSQVSPHFMFNTLNSMVALARKKSDKLEPALLKMSGLMHYMLYDSDEEKVSLQRETEYIQSYIDLQTMRFGNSVKILFMVNHSGGSQCIEPMLLIPLIENAFKHGVGVIAAPEISITLQSTENTVELAVSNKKETRPFNPADKTKGIGLNNLQKRLKLLYPAKHQLLINQEDNWFHASLKIETSYDKMPCGG